MYSLKRVYEIRCLFSNYHLSCPFDDTVAYLLPRTFVWFANILKILDLSYTASIISKSTRDNMRAFKLRNKLTRSTRIVIEVTYHHQISTEIWGTLRIHWETEVFFAFFIVIRLISYLWFLDVFRCFFSYRDEISIFVFNFTISFLTSVSTNSRTSSTAVPFWLILNDRRLVSPVDLNTVLFNANLTWFHTF